jgi:hypothetical protein
MIILIANISWFPSDKVVVIPPIDDDFDSVAFSPLDMELNFFPRDTTGWYTDTAIVLSTGDVMEQR